MNTEKELVQSTMEMLLNGETPTLQLLNEQWRNSSFIIEDKTSTGFFAKIKLEKKDFQITDGNLNFEFGDVYGSTSTTPFAIGFVLFVKNGILDFLESYTFGADVYPEPKEIKLIYSTGDDKKRDIQKLELKL